VSPQPSRKGGFFKKIFGGGSDAPPAQPQAGAEPGAAATEAAPGAGARTDVPQLPLPAHLREKWTRRASEPLLDGKTLSYYKQNGYTKGIRVFDDEDLAFIQENFDKLADHLGVKDLISAGRFLELQMWHRYSEWIYRICAHPRVVSGLQQILGPDVLLWASEFYVKYPGDWRVVPWHQDGAFWECAIKPTRGVTVFMPFFDVDRENACMQVIPGSHLGPHWAQVQIPKQRNKVFQQECRPEDVDESKIHHAEMKAGEVMFHHPAILHRSLPNRSKRLKAVLTGRYSPPDITCDRSRWPDFKQTLIAGEDRHGNNPTVDPPPDGAVGLPNPDENKYAPLDPPGEGAWKKRDPNYVTHDLIEPHA